MCIFDSNKNKIKYTIRSIVCEASRHPVIWSSGQSVIHSFVHPVIWSSNDLIIWSSSHLVIQSSGHPVIRSSSHPIIPSSCHFNTSTNEQTTSGPTGVLRRQILGFVATSCRGRAAWSPGFARVWLPPGSATPDSASQSCNDPTLSACRAN